MLPFTANCQTKSSGTCSKFDSILSNLACIPSRSSLVSIAPGVQLAWKPYFGHRACGRERAWVAVSDVHQRLVALFGELDAAFGELGGTPSSRAAEQEGRLDLHQRRFRNCGSKSKDSKIIHDRQSLQLDQLTSDYQGRKDYP
jgi:hypothetical protein